jgi:hypothetical protein
MLLDAGAITDLDAMVDDSTETNRHSLSYDGLRGDGTAGVSVAGHGGEA